LRLVKLSGGGRQCILLRVCALHRQLQLRGAMVDALQPVLLVCSTGNHSSVEHAILHSVTTASVVCLSPTQATKAVWRKTI
jgi:hypothetical protein